MSDVVAFVFVFSIIITSVGIVTAVGFSALEDFKASEQSVNAERGFQSLGDNLGNVQRGHAPGRSGEIKTAGGRLLVTDGSSSEITISNGSWSHTFPMRTLRYDMDSRNTSVAYESGAVFRRDRGGVVGISRPKFTCRPGQYVLVSVVTIESDATARGGDNTVQVIGREQSSRLVRYDNPTSANVTVDVTSEFEQGWDQLLEDNGWYIDSGVAECDPGPSGTVILRHTVIEIQFVS